MVRRSLGAALFLLLGVLAAGCGEDGASETVDASPGPDATPSPLHFEQLGGISAQGSTLWGVLTLVDPDARFHAVTSEDGLLVTDPVVVAPDGIRVQVAIALDPESVNDTRLGVGFDVDVGVPAGPVDLELRYADGTTLARPAAFEVAARAPIELSDAIAVSGEVAEGETALYRFGMNGRSIAGLSAPGVDDTSGTMLLLGPTGSFTDVRSSLATSGTVAADQIYAVVYGPAAGADEESLAYELTARSAFVGEASVVETAENDDAASAQAVTLPITVTDAIADYVPETGFDEDWYRVVVTSADEGKALAASILAPVDTYPTVRVFAPDGETVLASPPAGLDSSYNSQTVFTAPLAAGTYYVECSAELLVPVAMPYTVSIGLAHSELSR